MNCAKRFGDRTVVVFALDIVGLMNAIVAYVRTMNVTTMMKGV